MTELSNIKLKSIILGWFLLFCVLAPVKNIATSKPNDETINHDNIAMNSDDPINGAAENPNNNTNPIRTITKKILGEGGYLFGFTGNIIDWISTSIYNYHTEHNNRKSGLYHGRFFVYGGIKIKITKNLYLDVYYSLLKLIPFFIFDVIIISPNMTEYFFFSLLTLSINIRIYKNFYLSISPICLTFHILLALANSRFYATH